MMNKKALKILILMSVLLLIASGCSNDSLNGTDTDQLKTTAINVSIAFPQQSSAQSPSFAITGTFDDIETIYLDVTQEIATGTHFHVTDYPLTHTGGIWSAIVDDLPVDTTVSFMVRALDSDSTDIFSGTTQTSLSGGGSSVIINLSPIGDGILNAIPIIAQISRPAEIIRLSTNATASLSFKGNAGETLNFDISSDTDGSFSPASGSIMMSGSGMATQISTYNAPETEGVYTYTVTLTNSQNNYVKTTFPTTIVAPSSTTDSGILAFISPVLLTMSGERNGSEVTWSADVTDDGPPGELTYMWTYEGSGDLSFIDPTSNPAVLQNYTPTAAGTIFLTITDGNGGETEIGIQLAVNQFPITLTEALEYRLPDTSQVESYTDTFGEDSDYSINPIGYSNNGDGTITDNNSLLIWEQTDTGTTLSYADAMTYCGDLSLGGYTDWRLPSIQELKDLTYFKSAAPFIDEYYFLNINSASSYWSSSGDISGTAAKTVSYGTGTTTDQTKTKKYLYRCARGDTLTSGSFSDNYNTTVSDPATDLMWQQVEAGGEMIWETAVTYCENLILADYSDWRLPNIKELYSLVDATQIPAIDSTFFSGAFADSYWASTASSANNRWYVNFADGTTSNEGGTKSNYVRCVRTHP